MASFSRGAVPVGIMVVIADGDGGHVVMGSRRVRDITIDYPIDSPPWAAPVTSVSAACYDWETIMMPAGWSFVPRAAGELSAPVPKLKADTTP